MKKLILYLVAFAFSNPIVANESYFDKKDREVVCAEPLPKFTLSEKSNPSNSEVKKLCTCIWTSFPNGGWEQRASEKLRAGLKPEQSTQAFANRFGEALKKCDGYKL